LSTARFQHTATLLNDGRVFVVGGSNSAATALASTEIYDPSMRTWSAGAPLAVARALHTATLLSDGRVLVAGGVNALGVVGSAEIYDPAANAWSSAGTMSAPRVLHSSTLLPKGQVLVAGGRSSGSSGLLASAELYDPTANTWTLTTPMATAENGVGAVLLVSGKVLRLTGVIYDPETATWSFPLPPQGAGGNSGPPSTASNGALLPDGRVLVTGAFYGLPGASTIYDPISQTWTDIPFVTGAYSSATALANGEVLSVGGVQSASNLADAAQFIALAHAALFDPMVGSWTVLSSGAHQGALASAAVMHDGRVLVSGGNIARVIQSFNTAAAADLYDPTSNAWQSVAPMSIARRSHITTVLVDGSALVTGGAGGSNSSETVYASAERYAAQANAWTTATAMANPRYEHSASLLGNGKVLVAGGSNAIIGSCNCTTFIAAAELYDPTANSWTTTASLLTARYAHTATVLLNGKVLVAGGFGGTPNTLQNVGAALASAELYDPTAGTWSPAAPMNTARTSHTATLLSSGRVLVVGGGGATTTTATAEIYDPVANTWAAVASLTTPRQSHSATLLGTGNVLVVGGYNTSSSATFGVDTAELYDPVANTFGAAGSMVTLRQQFTLSALGDGRVMLVGGLPNLEGLPEFYR
jgi:N-acetylneuraminic acid mutarotase